MSTFRNPGAVARPVLSTIGESQSNVIELKAYRERTQPESSTFNASTTFQEVAPEDLYDTPRPELIAATGLLNVAILLLDEAFSEAKHGDAIRADDCIIRLQAMLPELFCFRKLGSGYAAVIGAAYFSLKSAAGHALTPDQIFALKNALLRARIHPFAPMSDVVEYVMRMEDVGLKVDAPGVGDFYSAEHE